VPSLADLPTHLWVLAACVAGCWLLSVVTRECSWVDRLWSIVPPVYVAIWAHRAEWADPRLILMTLLSTAWGVRLTWNFARKGGYAPGGEDYRWGELRRRLPGWAWHAFNLLFVAAYQNVLLLLITLPAWWAWVHRGTPLGALDALATALFVAFLVGETVADQQQWRFHQEKKARLARGEEGPGFLDRGLFVWSRHPNFFCEQGQWWALYLFSVAAGAPALNGTIAGAVLLTLLFDGSTRFTESISRSKYPAYADYQRRTSRIVPLPPRLRDPVPTA
jgi:steroid 5-alpha reductase family enzyme